jgi:ubiquinone/menaquinone biosynthesis C-methylase UbiE
MQLINFLLDHLYAEFAWAYDLVSWVVSLGRWEAWRRVALRYLQGEQRILEVGCGTGHLLHDLAGRARLVFGCDSSPAMLRQARRRAGRMVPLCRARAQALPFSAAAFDTVVCTFPAGYISDPHTWAEFARVLAPGGRVVVVYGVSAGGRTLGQRLVRLLLALGRTSGAALRPAWEDCSSLQVQHVVVVEGRDQVGLLVAEKARP